MHEKEHRQILQNSFTKVANKRTCNATRALSVNLLIEPVHVIVPAPRYAAAIGCFAAMVAAIFSRSCFSCSINARSALVTRGFLTVVPPREPGPPPRPLPLPEVSPRVVPPLPRPRPRLIVPSALIYTISLSISRVRRKDTFPRQASLLLLST